MDEEERCGIIFEKRWRTKERRERERVVQIMKRDGIALER